MRMFMELFILFFIISILGWCMEVILKYIQFHRFINRGFLIGPYCPVYGYGVLFIVIVIGYMFRNIDSPFLTFLMGVLLCGIIEYATSWYLEHRFHARWWDYSKKPLNIHGRVWIGNLLLFGIAAVLIIYFIAPLYFNLISKINNVVLYSVGIPLLIIFVVDTFVSYFMMNIIKSQIDKSEADNSEEIAIEVRKTLKDKNLLLYRITKAYPDFKARPNKLVKELKNVKSKYKEKVEELKKLEKECAIKKDEYMEKMIENLKENKEKYHQKQKEIREKLHSYFK